MAADDPFYLIATAALFWVASVLLVQSMLLKRSSRVPYVGGEAVVFAVLALVLALVQGAPGEIILVAVGQLGIALTLLVVVWTIRLWRPALVVPVAGESGVDAVLAQPIGHALP